MQFKKDHNDATDDNILQTWTSETGAWRVEVYRVMFGARVRARHGLVWSYSVDYCFGPNQQWIEAGAVAIMRILEGLAETAEPAEVEQIMPMYNSRPMARDPRTWRLLCEMARVDGDDLEGVACLIDDYDAEGARDYFTHPNVEALLEKMERTHGPFHTA